MSANMLVWLRFQWVKCQVDYLLSPMTDAERREALKSLPPNLTSTYVRYVFIQMHQWLQ
jgi:hypothetical protein